MGSKAAAALLAHPDAARSLDQRLEPAVSTLPANKVALVHVARRDLALSDDDYRAILARLANVGSAKDLDLQGFESVIGYLAQPGFKSNWQKRTFRRRPGMATPAQVQLIRRLWRDYHGSDDDTALNAWMSHFHHIAALRFVDALKAQPIIAALKQMVARQRTGH